MMRFTLLSVSMFFACAVALAAPSPAAAANVDLVRIFSPEHGLAGQLDQEVVADGSDQATGTPVVSLYRPEQRRPAPEMLADLDALVFDIQDVGARFYTYISTMAYAIEERGFDRKDIVREKFFD